MLTKIDLLNRVFKIILQQNTKNGLGCEYECREPRYCQCDNCAITAEIIVDSLFNDDLTLKETEKC